MLCIDIYTLNEMKLYKRKCISAIHYAHTYIIHCKQEENRQHLLRAELKLVKLHHSATKPYITGI